MRTLQTDVLVIGGGPAGSTTAAILRKYNPTVRVTLVEQAEFPRYHIGESLVLEVNRIFRDSGVLDEVERAGFQRKAGATFIWGQDRKPWGFLFRESTGRRPHFEGMQDYTWHVDRARFDTMLLDHARATGVDVLQPARVTRLVMDGERVTGAEVDVTGEGEVRIDARFVVDASGRAGVVARRFGTRVFDPVLRNVATFGYWRGAELDPAVSLDWDAAAIAIVTTRTGWLWYIPMERGVVSVGAVTGGDRFRELTRDGVERYYHDTLRSTPEVERWLSRAELFDYPRAPRRVMVESDFNYAHSQFHGPGWALVGDAAGFLDPLLTFGVFMSVTGAQLLAYCLGTILDGRYPGATEERLLAGYEQHMRGYYESFRAMLCLFYAFNSAKEDYWEQARDVLRGHSLPSDVGSRDAFMALTFGYGVNTMLVHEATQHFGHVAMHRLRDMFLGREGAGVELDRMGDYDVRDLPPAARPRLREPYVMSDTVLPVPGTGRVMPATRVELTRGEGRHEGARFPRYLYLPHGFPGVMSRLDGTTTVGELLAELEQAGPLRSLGKTAPAHFLSHLLRSLSGLGAIDGL